MKILRTPDHCFENLPDYPFVPHYIDIDGLRVHYIDERIHDNSSHSETVLMLHGEPSWSFLYRHMIPLFVAAGKRAIAPDLIGFGKSDKPANTEDYTYQRHVAWMTQWMEALDLQNITLIGQDWGSLIGMRLVAENPERFSRVVIANGGLPTGDHPMSPAFEQWQSYSQTAPEFRVGHIINNGCTTKLAPDVVAAYDAPFPDDSYKAGARIFPSLVPTKPDDPATEANRSAWQALQNFEKPFLTAFSDSDPITAGGEAVLQKLIPGAKGQPHTTIEGAAHFLQEDKGPELAQAVLDFMAQG